MDISKVTSLKLKQHINTLKATEKTHISLRLKKFPYFEWYKQKKIRTKGEGGRDSKDTFYENYWASFLSREIKLILLAKNKSKQTIFRLK